MSINERIRYLRKNVLHLNQTDFAKKLGVTQTGVSYLERQGARITEQTIRTVCLVFGLREEWLRQGTEPMYVNQHTINLSDFVSIGDISELEMQILKAYFELEPEIRQKLIQHFKDHLMKSFGADKLSEGPGTPPGHASQSSSGHGQHKSFALLISKEA